MSDDEAVQTRWKFLKLQDGQIVSAHDSSAWEMQEWRVESEEVPECCESGFHCSRRALDTIEFVDGQIMALVEVRGRHDEGENKEAWEQPGAGMRRITRA